MGFVALLDARYGAAESALARSVDWAVKADDVVRAARATTYLALCQSDRADDASAEQSVTDALAALDRDDARARQAYARTILARLLLYSGRDEEAREIAVAAAKQARTSGGLSIEPFPLAVAAEAALAERDLNGPYGVNYKAYWVDERSGKVFCLVEAPDADAAIKVHREAHGLVADYIYEVTEGS